MQLRIGINTGDVLVDQRDIYGNSVNIAARLEALAAPGMVCVSQSIYDQTRAQPDFFFADRGAHHVKNIPYSIRVYEVAYEQIRVTLLTWLVARWGRLATASIAAILIATIVPVLMFRGQQGCRPEPIRSWCCRSRTSTGTRPTIIWPTPSLTT